MPQPKKFVSDSVKETVIKQYERFGLAEVGALNGFCKTVVRRIIVEAGIPLKPHGGNRKPTLQPHHLEEVVASYEQTKCLIATGKKYGVGEGPVSKFLKKHKKPVRHWGGCKRKYTANDHYFDEIDHAHKAYWLGFLMADGCIIDKGGELIVVAIGLHRRDLELLEKFKSDIEATNPIYKRDSVVTLSMHNPTMAKALAKLGCVPRKSLILEFPEALHPVFYADFIRGYSDGDGSFMNFRYKGLMQPHWEVMGTFLFLKAVQNILVSRCQVNANRIGSHNGVFRLNYGGVRQIKRIWDFFYTGADLFLERKKVKCTSTFDRI